MFKKIYYINLEHREDRRNNVEDQLAKINFDGPIERINAAYGKNLNLEIIPSNLFTREAIESCTNKKDITNTSSMTKGGMGISLSQKWIYEKVLCGLEDYALILEDDITLPNDFIPKVIDKINSINENFDILYLGYHVKMNNKIGSLVDYPSKIWGLFGYIINKKAAKSIIEIFPLNKQIDTEIPRAFANLKVLALKENERLITSPSSEESVQFGSDIQFSREKFTNINENDCNITLIIIAVIVILLTVCLSCNTKQQRVNFP